MNQRLVRIIALIAVVVGAIGLGYHLLFPAKFNMARWRSADSPAQLQDRHGMIGDVNRMIEDGTIGNREAALRYLGAPEKGDVRADNLWLYDLGARSEAAAPGAHDWLEISFGDSGAIVMHRVRQDAPE